MTPEEMQRPMIHEKVNSSAIHSIGYEPESKTMEVRWKSGTVSTHHNVPKDAHQMFKSAPSIGKHFATHVKKQYPSNL